MKRVRAIIVTIVIALSMICVACGNTPSERLDAPTNLRVQGSTLEWDAVENANGYTVYAAGKEYETNECAFDLSELSGPDTYKIEVMAIGDGIRYDDSLWATYTYTVTPTEPIVPTENLAYTLLADGSGYEVSRGKADLTGRVVIPDEYNGLPVKKIADGAFDLRVLNNPDKRNDKTTEFILPHTLEEIGKYAFAVCTALTEIDIPETVAVIGIDAFQKDISLKKVKLPSQLTYLSSMFNGCESLTKIEIPQTVEVIEDFAFGSCKSLVDIELPKGLKELGGYAFLRCTALTKIVIPEGVKRLENGVFKNCTALIDIEFPSKIDYIGLSIVEGTAWLNSKPDGYVMINDWLLVYKGELPNGGVIERIPSEIKHMAGGAFNHSELISIVIPDEVDIGNSMSLFAGCEYLKNVRLPSDLEILPTGLFGLCNSLTNVNIPNSVKIIGNGVFTECVNLNNVIIPSGVTEIGYNAFYRCNGMTHLYYAGTKQQWEDKKLSSAGAKKTSIYYYAETKNDIPESGGNYWHYDVDGQTPVIW